MSELNPAGQKQFFGHPRGLSTLFFTEMWERFSYYGMRALLVLFMTDATRGGMAWGTQDASAIYGLYTFGVYVLALPGGWLADRLIGKKNAVLWGGIVIALGHYVLAIPAVPTYFVGLALVAIGTGFLKPNVSAIVGDLYPEGGARRDAGFSIFYMGINIGAILGPTICSYLGENISWHLGFGAAGVGMTAAVVQYVMGQKYLAGIGEVTEEAAKSKGQAKKILIGGLVGLAAIGLSLYGLNTSGILPFSLVQFVASVGVILAALALVYFLFTIAFSCHTPTERKHVFLIMLLFIGAALFWSGFEQAGSSMNLFAEDHTNRMVGSFEVPTGWLQNINPLFIVLLAPVVGMLWVKMGSRNPSVGWKFAMGMVLLGSGFFVLAWGSQFIADGKLSPGWLVVTYFFHTIGELCLSPVGLSYTTKLAPKRLVSQMMGMWFVGAAIGNLIAGLVAGFMENMSPSELFRTVAMIMVGSGVVFALLAPLMKRLAKGVE
jgi:POT family proton-dependent oligopeptide transporter